MKRVSLPGTTFVKEYVPDEVVNTEETTSSVGDKSSTFTLGGPSFFLVQLSPPTAPTTLPDTVNLHQK